MIYGNIRKPVIHPDVQEVINVASANSENLPSQIYLNRLSETIYLLEENGIWNKLDAAFFRANELRDFSRYCFKRHVKDEVIGNESPFTAIGFKGIKNTILNGFNSKFNPYTDANNYQLNDASCYVYQQNHNESAQGNFIGCIGISPATGRINIGKANSTTYSLCMNGGNVNIAAPTNCNHYLIARNNSANFQFYTDNNSPVDVTSVSTTLPNNLITIHGRNTSTSLIAPNVNTPVTGVISVVLLGSDLRNDFGNIKTIIDNYLKLTF